ncbi:hypothetical protein [Nonomuraea monospora]
MASRTNAGDARKPAASAHAFDGGIATKDVEPVWQTEALPGWVVHHLIPLLTAGQSWPKGSESRLWELRVEYVKLMNLLIGTLDPTAATVQTLNGSLQSPAKPAVFKRLAALSDDKAGVVAKAQEAFSYAKMVDNFARETQYSKLSVNVAFWVAVIAAFIALVAAGFTPLAGLLVRSAGTAGASRIALIMQRLVLAASRAGTAAKSGQITKLAAAGTGGKFLNGALLYELFEEITEEVFIDVWAQYQQIKMGTRDTWDWKKIQAAAIGAGTGAVIGTKLGGPMSRFTNDLPGISRLNRMAGDKPGVGNAFLRFPGRALNTGLNNMAASPAGSIAANYVVYDQFALPGAEGFYGGFLGGAGRTGTISPFNPSVALAIGNPLSTLSSKLDTAITTPPDPHATADALLAVPRPSSPDGAAALALPPQQQTADLTGPARRDRAATFTEPALPHSTPKRTPTAPDIITPDAIPSRAAQNNSAKTQPDLPAPQHRPEPADQQDPQPEPQPAAQDNPPVHRQPAATRDQAPAEPPAVPTGPPQTSSAPEPADVPEPANAPEPAAAPEQATAPGQTTAPGPADMPDGTGEPQTVLPPEATGPPQDTGTPGTTTETAYTTGSTTSPTYAGPAASPMPTPQNPNGAPAPGLLTRLIGAARRTRDSYALVAGRPDKNSGFVADGRHPDVPSLTVQEARAAFEAEVRASDLGATVIGLRWTGPGTLVVELSDLPAQTFVFEVGPVRRGRLGRTVVGEGNVNEVRLAPRVAPDQVARLVLHEIVDTLHARNHPRQHLLRRLGGLLSSRNECLTARRHEEAFLTRRIGEVSAAEQPALMAQRDAVRNILLAHGLPRLPVTGPPPDPAQAPSPVADPLTRLRERDQAVASARLDLDQALAEQIYRLLRIERALMMQEVAAIGTAASPLLIAVSQARAAYEAAQSLLHTAGGSTTRVTGFAQALHTARRLHLLYEEQVDAMATEPALPVTPQDPDALRQHIATLRSVAANLAGAARTPPGTAADRQAAAASAVRAAETYQSLLDQVDAGRVVLAPPNVLVTQLLRLGATYERHHRQIAVRDRVASAHGAQNIDDLHRALLEHVSGRQSAAVALRATIESLAETVKAQGNTVTAYNLAAGHAYALAAEALAGQHLSEARLWRARAENLSRIAELHRTAWELAKAARDAHRELADPLAEVIAGTSIGDTRLGVLTDAAAAALRSYQEEIDQLPPAVPPDLPKLSEVPSTARTRLWTRTQERAEALEAAYLHNVDLSLRHWRDAETANLDALDARNKAAEHAQAHDDSADERARREEANAKVAASTADHHLRMEERYAAAAAAALHALQAIEPVLAALAEVTTQHDPATPQVELALNELTTREGAYDSAYRATLPPVEALPGSKIAGPVANLTALTELVNEMLTQQGVAGRITEEELRWSIRQAFHTALSSDGMVLRLNTATGAQLRLRLKLDDLKEVARPDSSHSETMFGLLRQGGGQSAMTDLRSLSGNMNLPLMAWLRAFLDAIPIGTAWPADLARAVAYFGVLNVNLRRGRTHAVTISAQDTGLGGNVEDNRGMAAMFDARATWEVELLTPSGRPVWRALPADDETARQRLWVSHAYLSGPADTIQLPEADRRQTPFPEHVVSDMTGLSTLADKVTDRLESAGLSPVARDQVTTMITEDLPSNLGEAINNPSGLRRIITVNGQVRAVVTVHTTVVSEGELVGGPTTKHHQERLRNASSNAGQSRSDGHSGGVGAAVGANADPEGKSAGDFAPHATVRRDPGQSSSVSTSANAVAIHPSVQRWAGHTQGYLLDLEHTVTIQVFGKGSETVSLDPAKSTGLFRVPEPDAYRYGLPVDAAAEAGHAPDGTVLLRDDPVREDPPGRVRKLPSMLGDREGQTRGAGPALVQQVTGMDAIRARVEEQLRARGLLPKLKNGVSVYSLIPWVRAGQIANEQLIAEQFSASRLEAGYDQAAQEGLFINLVHYGEGFAARHYTLRIKLTQDFGRFDYQGITDAEPVVDLDIGSDTHVVTQTRGTSSAITWRAGEGFSNDPGIDASALDGSYSHGKGGQTTVTTATTVNQVTLMEGSGLTAVFRIPHTISVDLLIGPSHEESLVKGQAGDARILLPADLLPLAPSDDGHPRPESPRHPTSKKAIRLARVIHLDVGDTATTAANMLADPLDRDSPQFQHLAAFFNVRNLISHPEVISSGSLETSSSGHRTGVDTLTATGEPQNQPVSLSLAPGESRFLSATDLVIGDINLTLGSHAGLTQQSRSRGLGVTTGVPVPGMLGSEGGIGGSLSTTTTREQKVISGPERLGIDTGKQYLFAMDVTSELTVGVGAEAVETDTGTVIYRLAERDALDLYASGEVKLPLHQAADAAERLMNGDLRLSRRVAVRFLDRYFEDLADARARNAGRPVVPGVPLTAWHFTGRALARLLELFPDDRLTELLPPGMPPGPPSETAGDTRDRLLSKPEFYPYVLDKLRADAQRLENGEVPGELAPNYSDSIGMSTVKQVGLHPAGEPDTDVDLLSQIRDAVNEVAPGALDQDNKLWRGLMTDFSRESWLGKIDSLLDPDSPGNDYTVEVDGIEDLLEVTVRAELDEKVAYRGEVFDHGQIFQTYSMLEENVSESSNAAVSPSGKLGQESAENKDSGSTAANRGQTGKGSSNAQQARVQRVASFEGPLGEVRQGIRLSIEVRRVPKAQKAGQGQGVPRLPRSASRLVSGSIDRFIPAGMVSRPGTVPAPAPAVPDPRPMPVPENFAVETTRVRHLAATVEQRLKEELGVDLHPADAKALARLLSGNSRNSLFERMTAKDGHLVIQVPGNDGETIGIRVGAVLSEPVVIAAGLKATEIGQADRRQWTTSANADRTRLRPTGVTFGSDSRDEFLPSGLSGDVAAGNRDLTVDSSSVSGGNRAETSVFEKADAGSVRFRVDYHVRFEVWSDPGTDVNPSDITPARHVATGNADVLLFDKVMRAIQQQAESPGATAALSGGPGLVSFGADPSAPPYGQLRQAQLLSRERGAGVQITIHPANRQPQTYLATPDGRLRANGGDEAFARRFAGLPSPLIAAAEQHGIDLLELHERARTDVNDSLAEHLRRELSRLAVHPPGQAPGWPVTTEPDGSPEPVDPGHGEVTHGSPDPASRFVPDGRTSPDDLTPAEARSLSEPDLIPEDFGDAVTAITWLSDTELIVQHTTLGQLRFTVGVGPVEGGYLGQTEASQNPRDGSRYYRMTLAPRVHQDQVARLVLHEISDVIQHQLDTTHTHTPGQTTRDECLTARHNELRYLQRKQQTAHAAGDTHLAQQLAQDIAAVQNDIDRRTRPSPSIHDVINSGRPGQAGTTEPEGDAPAARSALDHATRTAQLNMNPATRPEERLANSYDPREVPWAAQWERLRESATPLPVTITEPPTRGAVQVEVRRLLVPWKGSTRPVTEFTLRVLYRANPGMSPDEIAIAHTNLLDGVDLYYNYQHELADGSQLHIRMEFVPAPDSAPPDGVILLSPGTGHRAVDFADRHHWHGNGEVISTPLKQLRDYAGRPAINYMSWYARQEPIVFAHEVMHLLGMSDEYMSRWAGADRNRLGASGVRADATLLGSAVLFWSDHGPVLDRDGRAVAGISSLRDRHVEHIYGLVPERAPQPKVPLRRPAAPVDGAEWTRPEYRPGAHLPHDVRGLLDAFPPEDRPLLDHLRLLERMAGLFPNVSPLLLEHVEYTDALVRTAQQIYDTGPEYSFDLSELVQLKNLFDRLAPDEAPDIRLLHQEINSALRRPAPAPVGHRLVQIFITSAESGKPQGREAAAAALYTAAVKELRRLGGTLQEALERGDVEVAGNLTREVDATAELAREMEAVLESTGAGFVREHLPYAHLSDAMRSLLRDFPPEGSPLLDHVRRLQRMATLFHDAPRLTPRHLEHTDALVVMALELYGVSHEERLGTYDIGNVKVLSDVLLGDVMPDSDLLREQLNGLLGRRTSASADRQAIQELAWYAGYVSPLTGEAGPARLLEGIAVELAELEEELLDAQQSGDTAEAASLTRRIETAGGWASVIEAAPGNAGESGTNESGVTHGSPDPASRFVPDGRTSPDDLTPAEARSLSEPDLIPEDFGDAVTAITWLSDTELIVQHTTLGELRFTIGVGPVENGYLGRTMAEDNPRAATTR